MACGPRSAVAESAMRQGGRLDHKHRRKPHTHRPVIQPAPRCGAWHAGHPLHNDAPMPQGDLHRTQSGTACAPAISSSSAPARSAAACSTTRRMTCGTSGATAAKPFSFTMKAASLARTTRSHHPRVGDGVVCALDTASDAPSCSSCCTAEQVCLPVLCTAFPGGAGYPPHALLHHLLPVC